TAYGSHKFNPLGFTEEFPLAKNPDSYYNTSKVEVENFVTGFFKTHPDIVLTVIRAGLLCGPNIANMFSDLWSRKITALPLGRNSHNQLVHEEDMGDALHLALKKDLPGIFNVCADDALATRWMFKAAGAKALLLPVGLLKTVLNVMFKLRLEKVSQGWVSMAEYTIFGNCDKFKKASGWQPRYTSAEAFNDFLNQR
ncbi:MAG: epimerase, partial [Proteobacteria bacterium]|nr:epimerase [Pseudomonadota bacterium]